MCGRQLTNSFSSRRVKGVDVRSNLSKTYDSSPRVWHQRPEESPQTLHTWHIVRPRSRTKFRPAFCLHHTRSHETGLCASNSFSSTGAPPCTTCPDGEVSGTGATTCIRQGAVVVDLTLNICARAQSYATRTSHGGQTLGCVVNPARTPWHEIIFCEWIVCLL